MISASCPSVLVYAKSITFLLCQYLITWCWTSMCFVRLFVIKLVAIFMQVWLSSRKRTGSSIWMPNSLRKERSQTTALHAPTIVRYSAAAVDWARTPGCKLQLKSITSPLSTTKKTHLLRRVSGQEAKPAQYGWNRLTSTSVCEVRSQLVEGVRWRSIAHSKG